MGSLISDAGIILLTVKSTGGPARGRVSSADTCLAKYRRPLTWRIKTANLQKGLQTYLQISFMGQFRAYLGSASRLFTLVSYSILPLTGNRNSEFGLHFFKPLRINLFLVFRYGLAFFYGRAFFVF